jgi:hypothetical protein
MGDYERHKGTLRPIELTEDTALEYLKQSNAEREDYYGSAVEQLLDDTEDFIKIGGQIYKLENHEEFGCDLDFSEVHKNEDGSYDFHALFYNGGTCLSEMIGWAIEELNGK